VTGFEPVTGEETVFTLEPTDEPDPFSVPDPMDDPGATATPESTAEPDATATPEPTVEPEATADLVQKELVVITALDPLDEEICWQGYDYGQVASEGDLILPSTLTGKNDDDDPITIEEVVWQSDPAFDPTVSEFYLFTPELPAGYALAEGVMPPEISVFIRPGNGMQLMALEATGIDITADFTDPNFLAAVRELIGKGASDPILDSDVAGILLLGIEAKGIQNLSGIEHFRDLTVLNCNDNQLVSLPILPPELVHLYCKDNQLASLPTLPTGLQNLDCRNNQLASLPTLPPGLGSLECGNNQLTLLPTLPSGMTFLRCENNQLASLPTMPLALKHLDCRNNQLASLPTLPSGLEYLDCGNNKLSSLPMLPSGIITLECSHNLLTSLPSLPSTLNTLTCFFNQLATLPPLPSNLVFLGCGYNPLTTLPTLPSGLEYLACGNSQLSSLPTLPSNMWYLDCSHNLLTTLPTLPSSLTHLLCGENQLTGINVSGLALSTLWCSWNNMANQSAVIGFPGIWDGVNYFFTPQRSPLMYAAIVSPTSKSYPSATVGYAQQLAQQFTITNTGTGTITNLSATFGTGTSFDISTALTPLTIAPNGTATVSVRPKTGLATGTYTDTLAITADDGILLTVNLSFTVNAPTYTATVNPTSRVYPAATIGYAAQTPQLFTITNTGTGTITGLSATFGTGTNFDISTAIAPLTIAPNGTATVSVRPKNGLVAGTYTDTLAITADNGLLLSINLSFAVNPALTYIATVSPTSRIFPATTVGYLAQAVQQFTVRNTGTGTITGLSAAFNAGTGFDISTALTPLTIAPNGTATVSVRPKTGLAAGIYTDILTFTGNNGFHLTIDLSFTVNTPTYTATVNPTSRAFPTVIVGYSQQAAQQFVIRNTGTGTITGLAATLNAGTSFDISSALTPLTITPNGTATVSVRPKTGLAPGVYTDTLTITGNSGFILTVGLSFTVNAHTYTATVSPISRAFSTVPFNYSTQSAQQFTITNTGTGTISNLSASLNVGSRFEISSSLTPVSIAPRATATVSVRPRNGLAAGAYADRLTIRGDNGLFLAADLSFIVSENIAFRRVMISHSAYSAVYPLSRNDANRVEVTRGGTWLTATLNGSGSLVITAARNATSSSRTGCIDVYFGNGSAYEIYEVIQSSGEDVHVWEGLRFQFDDEIVVRVGETTKVTMRVINERTGANVSSQVTIYLPEVGANGRYNDYIEFIGRRFVINNHAVTAFEYDPVGNCHFLHIKGLSEGSTYFAKNFLRGIVFYNLSHANVTVVPKEWIYTGAGSGADSAINSSPKLLTSLPSFFDEAPDDLKKDILDTINNAPAMYRDILLAAFEKIKNIDWNSNADSSNYQWFNFFNRKIEFNLAGKADEDSIFTIFHEIGHMTDDIFNTFGDLSRSMNLYEAMWDDMNKITGEAISTVLSQTTFYASDNGFSQGNIDIEKVSNYLQGKGRQGGSEYNELNFDERQFVAEVVLYLQDIYFLTDNVSKSDYLTWTTEFIKAQKSEQEALFEYFFRQDIAATILSDIMGGMTDTKVQGAQGHNAADYWFTDGLFTNNKPTYNQEKELWAHFFAAQVTGNQEALDQLKAAFPKSYVILEEMAKLMHDKL